MANYQQFYCDVDRMPRNKKSSMILPNDTSYCHPCNTICEENRRQASCPSYVDPCIQCTSRQQTSSSNSVRPNSTLVRPVRNTGRVRSTVVQSNVPARPRSPRQTRGKPQTSGATFRGSARPGTQYQRNLMPSKENYNMGGRPLNLLDFAEDTSRPVQQEDYNTVGRPLNLLEFVEDNRRIPVQQVDSYHDSGQRLQLSEFGTDSTPNLQPLTPEDFNSQPDNYDSGRPLNLLTFRQEQTPIIRDSHNASGRPFNAVDLAQDGGQYLQPFNDSFNASGRPFNAVDLAQDGGQYLQPFKDSYNASGRPFNAVDLAQDGGQYLQVPREQHGAHCNASGRPFNAVDLAQDGGQYLQPFKDSYNASGRPFNAVDLAQDGGQYLQVPREQHGAHYNASGRPFNAVDLAQDGGQYLQPFKDSYNASGRPFNAVDLAQGGGQYLQVPREQHGAHYNASGRPFNAVDLAQDDGQYLQQPCQPQRPGIRSNVCPSQEQEGYPACSREGRPACRKVQCPILSEEQLVQYLQYGDLNQISPGNLPPSAPRNPLFNTVVKDNYYPGVIDDAANGRIDFNRLAFDAVFDTEHIPTQIEPEDVPMSLLEAFELRIQYENDLRQNLARQKEFCLNEQKKEMAENSKNEAEVIVKKVNATPEDVKFWIHPEELKLASTIDIDLASNFRNYPETGLTEALSCLFKAEKMNDFDKYVHIAEEAIRSTSPDKYEKAALKSQCSFQINMQNDEAKPSKTYKPIEVISYIGTTKPIE